MGRIYFDLFIYMGVCVWVCVSVCVYVSVCVCVWVRVTDWGHVQQ